MTNDARPGFAIFHAEDSDEEIEEKVKIAFGPVHTALEAMAKYFPPRTEESTDGSDRTRP